MSESHSLRLEINAGGAKKGAADFEGAIRRIDRAVQNLDKNSSAAFTRLQRNATRVNFTSIANAINRINNLRINPSLVNNLTQLSSTLGRMRGVSPQVITSLRSLSSAINTLGAANANLRNINNLFNSLSNIRPINPAAIQGINLIGQSIRNLGAPRNTSQIVSALNQITVAATAAYAALRQLAGQGVTVRVPRVGPGTGGTSAINPATGRAYGGVSPGYGFGPGRSSASGMRGFENVASVPYQAGSAVRGATGALTAGAFLQGITTVTRQMDMFRMAMTSVGVTAEETETMIQSLANMSRTMGLDFMSTVQNMRGLVTSMVATGVSVQDAQGMFENLAVAMRSAGLGPAQQEGALRAIGQMFGKGRIMAEEFRQQLGEHWTSVAPIFARYVYPEIEDANERMSRLTQDMEKIGFRPDAFVRFSAFLRQELGAGLQRNMTTLDAAILRMRSNWQLLMKTLGEGRLGESLIKFMDTLSDIMARTDFKEFINDIGNGLAGALDRAGGLLVTFANNLDTVRVAGLAIFYIGLANLFIGITRAVTGLFGPLVAVGRWLGGVGGGTKLAGAGATAAVGAFANLRNTLVTLLSVGSRVFAFLAAHPFVRIGLAVVALGTLLYNLAGGFDGLKRKAEEVWDYVAAAAEWAKRRIQAAWEGSWLETIFNKVGDAFKTITDRMEEIRTQSPATASVLQTYMNGVQFGPVITGLITIKDLITWLINNIPSIPSINITANIPELPEWVRRYMPSGQTVGRAVMGAVGVDPNMVDRNIGAGGGIARGVAGAAGEIASDARNRRADRIGAETAEENARRLGQLGANRAPIGIRGGTEQLGPPAPGITPLTPQGRQGVYLPNGGGRGGGGGANRREQVENFIGRLDPTFRVMEELADGERTLAQARQMGIGTAQDHVRWNDALRESFYDQLGALDPTTRATRRYEAAMRTLEGAERAGLISGEALASARERLNAATEQARNPVEYMINRMREETDLLNSRNGNYETEIELLRIRNQMRSQGIILQDQDIQRIRENIEAQRRAQQAYKDSQEGVASWANSFRDFGTELRKLEEKFLNEFADALTDFVMTGKANWRDLANSIVRDINQLIIKQGIRELLKWLGVIEGDTGNGFQNTGQGIVGSIFGGSSNRGGGGQSGGRGIFGEVLGFLTGGMGGGGFGSNVQNNPNAWANLNTFAPTASGGMYGPIDPSWSAGGASGGGMAGSGGGGWGSIIGSIFNWIVGGFSEGGYSTNPVTSAMMPATAFVNAPHFREGGMSSGGIPAVLHDNEAVIPLSRGRKIPVEGGGQRVTNNFHISTPDADSFRMAENQILNRYSRKMTSVRSRGG